MSTEVSGVELLQKIRKTSALAFIVLLGGGSAMVLLAIPSHNVIMWAMGLPIAGMSGIFVTMGLIAKQKLRKLGIR